MRRGLSLLLAVALFFPLSLRASASIRPEGSVWDEAQVLDESLETTINTLSEELFRESGAEIAVMTVDFLSGKDIDDFTYDTFNDLGIGSKERNNGVLLVLAIAQDDYYVMVGSGIDDYFTGAKLQAMLDEYLEPYFAKYEYSKAVALFCDQMYLELKALRYDDRYSGTGQEFHAKAPASAAALFFGPLLKYGLPVLLIIAVIALAIWLRSRWGRSSASAAPVSVSPEEGAKPEEPTSDAQETPAAPLPTPNEGCGCSAPSLGCGGLVLGGVLLLIAVSIQSVLLVLISFAVFVFALIAFPFGDGGSSSGGGGSGGTSYTPARRHDDDDDDPPSFSGFSGGSWSSHRSSSHSSSSHSSSSHSSGFSSGGSSRGGGAGRSGRFSSGGSTRGGGAGRRK